jgi:hypothetical protein
MPTRAQPGKICRHCMGLTFTHPADWGALRTCDGVILTPPTFEAESPSMVESYFIMTEASMGATRAIDPAIWSSMDELVRGQFRCLRRMTQIEPVTCGRGSGARATWAGSAPAGRDVAAHVFVSLDSQTLAALVAVGPAGCLLSRLAALESIFTSFRHEPCRTDPQLVGTWVGSRRRRPEAQVLVAQRLRLQVDGTFSQGLPRSPGRADARDSSGIWSVRDGWLVLSYEADAPAEYRYRVEGSSTGQRLLLVGADGRAIQMRLTGN